MKSAKNKIYVMSRFLSFRPHKLLRLDPRYLLSALRAKYSSFVGIVLPLYVLVPPIDGLTLLPSRVESCRIQTR